MIQRIADFFSYHDGDVHCSLCPWECVIKDGQKGSCGVRENREGVLYSNNYGRLTSITLENIEKKPLFHFHPDSQILSIGSFGCSLHCKFCQNWVISQDTPPTDYMSPEEVVDIAKSHQQQGNIGVAYTYNEPIVMYEYLMEVMPLVSEAGMKNVLVTNGIINKRPLEGLLPFIDAMSIDLKSMNKDFYKDLCGGSFGPPIETIETAFPNCHIELVNLIIPGENDSNDDINAVVDFVAGLDDAIPLHFSAYRPAYKFGDAATPIETMTHVYTIASKKLKYVYINNLHIGKEADTFCPECHVSVVSRSGFTAKPTRIKNGKCSNCGADLNIVQGD